MARRRNSMSRTRALEVAIRRLQNGPMPLVRAAAAVLVDLRAELLAHEESSSAAKISLLKPGCQTRPEKPLPDPKPTERGWCFRLKCSQG
jgi:hypothetical protein